MSCSKKFLTDIFMLGHRKLYIIWIPYMIHKTQSAQISQKHNRHNIYAIMKTMCPVCRANELFLEPSATICSWTFCHITAVCSVVPGINLSHMQKSYLCQKNQNYLLEKAYLRLFLSYGLRTTTKSIIAANFSSSYNRNSYTEI